MSKWLEESILQNIQILIGARVLITETSRRTHPAAPRRSTMTRKTNGRSLLRRFRMIRLQEN